MLAVERKRERMKDKATSLALALGLFLLCGVAGAVEAEAKPKPKPSKPARISSSCRMVSPPNSSVVVSRSAFVKGRSSARLK